MPLSLPHPRAYANFPRVIAEYVKKRHVLTLGDAIREMTLHVLTTRACALRSRAIREGLKADRDDFNEGRIENVASYEKPTASARRSIKAATRGRKPGSVLHGAGYDPRAAAELPR